MRVYYQENLDELKNSIGYVGFLFLLAYMDKCYFFLNIFYSNVCGVLFTVNNIYSIEIFQQWWIYKVKIYIERKNSLAGIKNNGEWDA